MVLVVLLLREGELLDLLLQPGGDLPASLHSLLLCFVQLGLHVLHLVLQVATVLLAMLGVLLLTTELIGKTSSVDHGLLGLVLGNPALADHLLKIGLQSLHLRVELPLCSLKRLVLQSAVGQLFHHVGELLLGSASLTISVLQLGLCLLELVGNSVVAPLGLDQTLPRLVAHDLLLLKAHLGGLDLVLVLLDGGLGLSVGTVGVLKGDAQLVHVSLQLLLDPSLDLLLDLSQLKLGPQHLVLLLFEGALSFFKSCLKLKLLALQAFPDFVNLVDGSTTLADLVHDVLDLSAERFIFPPDAIKLTVGLIVGCLHLEELRRVAATLRLGLVQLRLEPLDLVLPLSNDLVKVACLLLHRHAAGFRILHGDDGLLYFRLQLRLLPLEGHRFAIEVADTALSFSKSRLELHFRRLGFLGLGETLLLVLLPPHLRVSNRLGEKAKSIVLRSSLLLQLALGQVHLVLEVPVLAQQEGSLLGLGLGNLVHLIQLLGQGLPELPKHSVVVLQLFNAVEKLSIFNDNLLPRVVVVGEGEVRLLSPACDV